MEKRSRLWQNRVLDKKRCASKNQKVLFPYCHTGSIARKSAFYARPPSWNNGIFSRSVHYSQWEKKENRVRGSAACCRKVQSHKQGSFSLPLGAQELEASRKPKPPKQPISVYKIAPDELVCSRILRSPHSSCRFRAVRNFSVNHLQWGFGMWGCACVYGFWICIRHTHILI
jgi:hypothetical protein